MTKLSPKKRCAVCRDMFPVFNSMTRVCSPKCAIEWNGSEASRQHVSKMRNVEKRKAKESQKTLSEWHASLQTVVNRYVRLRDARDGCISCDKGPNWRGQWHCSHYYSVGSSSNVRFNLWNLHKSCSICNNWKSGNIRDYTPRLIEKIGQERFDWLEEHHSRTAHYDIDWIKRAIKIARKGIKRMERRCYD